MAVKFISLVEQDSLGSWYIKLTDTIAEQTVVCKDLEEYKVNIESMGAIYTGDIEVVWEKSKLLSPRNYQDLNEKMAKLQEEYQEEISQLQSQNDTQDGFNPNA